MFRHYAEVDFPAASAPLYAAIAREVAGDPDLLALVARRRPGQPAVNLLFAAVHYLLLSGAAHPLAAYYPDLTDAPLPRGEAYPQFRAFCAEHAASIVEIVGSRLVQTNVLERCGLLLPAFAAAAKALGGTELAMIEIGASAGLNLLWDRYFYDYGAFTWGDPASAVWLEIEVRGSASLPVIPPDLRAGWRAGIDLDPVDLLDADATLWQRALMWPERRDRQRRIDAVLPIVRADPARVVAGDACDKLAALLQEAPASRPLCLLASYSLYQFSPDACDRLFEIIEAHAAARPVALVTVDLARIGDAYGSVALTIFEGGARRETLLARGHPHGNWIEWLR